MRDKLIQRFFSQPSRLPRRNPVLSYSACKLSPKKLRDGCVNDFGSSQRGASTLLLALFVVAILVTVVIGLAFGHSIGYQRGLHSMQTEAKQASLNGNKAIKELEDLRTSSKIAINQAATAKQELEISLNSLKELRENQQTLTVENRQIVQLNEIYADIIVEEGGMPLQVLGAKIEPLPENAFEYGFDVGMLSEDGKAKLLKPVLTLLNGDEMVEVPLDPATYSIEGIVRLRGRFVMPKGFTPSQVKLVLEADSQEVEQVYDWRLGDRVDNMLPSLLDLPEVDESPIKPQSSNQ